MIAKFTLRADTTFAGSGMRQFQLIPDPSDSTFVSALIELVTPAGVEGFELGKAYMVEFRLVEPVPVAEPAPEQPQEASPPATPAMPEAA